MNLQTLRDELVPAIIALILLGVSAYLWALQADLPDSLKVLTASVVSFYYGGKTSAVVSSAVRSTAAKIAESNGNGNGNGSH